MAETHKVSRREFKKLMYRAGEGIFFRNGFHRVCFVLLAVLRTTCRKLPALLLGIRGKSTAGVILPLGESDSFDWSSDLDNTPAWIGIRSLLHDLKLQT